MFPIDRTGLALATWLEGIKKPGQVWVTTLHGRKTTDELPTGFAVSICFVRGLLFLQKLQLRQIHT